VVRDPVVVGELTFEIELLGHRIPWICMLFWPGSPK